jgi:hypothetical protein
VLEDPSAFGAKVIAETSRSRGYRFVGDNHYDALLLGDLSKSDKPSDIRPALVASYEVDPMTIRNGSSI